VISDGDRRMRGSISIDRFAVSRSVFVDRIFVEYNAICREMMCETPVRMMEFFSRILNKSAPLLFPLA